MPDSRATVAAIILAGLLAEPGKVDTAQGFARRAVSLADALMKELEATETER